MIPKIGSKYEHHGHIIEYMGIIGEDIYLFGSNNLGFGWNKKGSSDEVSKMLKNYNQAWGFKKEELKDLKLISNFELI